MRNSGVYIVISHMSFQGFHLVCLNLNSLKTDPPLQIKSLSWIKSYIPPKFNETYRTDAICHVDSLQLY